MARKDRIRNHTLEVVNSLRQQAITKAWAEHPLAGASLGWDEARGEWWVCCTDCQVPRHYTSDIGVATTTVARHNANNLWC